MAIRFRFRSNVAYDSVEIDGRRSISVRELRYKIIRDKGFSKTYQDFDLAVCDPASGLEYDDENFQIQNGSCVILRRVPARSSRPAEVPIDAVESFRVKSLYPKNSANDHMKKLDDFDADLYSSQAAIPKLDLEYEKEIFQHEEKANNLDLRFECAEVQPDNGSKGNIIGEERAEVQMKLEELLSNTSAVQNARFPSELKCSLCNTYFKDAVMIPCCQHSFCDRCIRQVLAKKARCPKCLSDKYSAENLLPNLSLRQAIEHFLESQILLPVASENILNKYAPDGESGIQGRDDSYGVTVFAREPKELPHSPTATGKGSNIILPKSIFGSSVRRNAGREPLAPKMQKGENNLRQNNVCDEADSTLNRKSEMWADTGGGDRSFLAPGRQFKGTRTCYKCGSPDHLIRDCPFSSGPRPMLQTGPGLPQGGMAGYASSYWNGASYPPFRPFPNAYGNPAMMPYSTSLVPATIYGVPPYAPNMYGGLPTREIMATGTSLTPRVDTAEHPPTHCNREFQCAEKLRKLNNEYLSRGQNEKSSRSSEKSSRSSVSGRDGKSYPSERSGPGLEHTHTRKDKYEKVGSEHHHERSSKRHHEKRQQSRSDSDKSRHHRVDVDPGGSHKKHDHSRHHVTAHRNERQHDDRRQMVSCSDEERGDDYGCRKRRRGH